MHPIRPRLGGHLGLQPGDGGRRKIGAPILLTLRGQLGQQQPRTHPDLQHPLGSQLTDPLDRRRPPLPHLLQRDRPAGITAIPTPEVFTQLPRSTRIHPAIELLPLTDQLGLAVGVTREHHLLIEYHITHQLITLGSDDRLSHPRMSRQRRFHLAEFDAKPANLDLIIHTPNKLQRTLGIPTHHIPAAIHPLPGRTERARHKPRRGQPRPTPIPARHTGTRDIQLTGHPDGHRAQPRVQHKHPRFAQRATNWHRMAGQLTIAGEICGSHRGFGRPVGVDHLELRMSGAQPAHRRRRQHIPTRP
ncbi:hypothetical protein MSIMFI_00132 [Mycobacterium simulans]|nr:hypothetical protein MSIMFI_00132 [Mycobacterium simulans]